MKLLTRSILCSALALIPLSQASATSPENGNFDERYQPDGFFSSYIPQWISGHGGKGVVNLTESQFAGEGGDGAHYNALYLSNSAKVSQHVSKELLPATPYILEFDIGYIEFWGVQNYIIKLETAGNDDPSKNGTILNLLNPVRPTQAGVFETVKIPFTLPEPLSGHYTLTVRTSGTGRMYFDNFELFANGQTAPSSLPYLQTVAYGNSLYSAATDSRTCTVDYSLDNGTGAYLPPGEGECQCVNSETILMSTTEYFSGDVRTFYQCRVTTQ